MDTTTLPSVTCGLAGLSTLLAVLCIILGVALAEMVSRLRASEEEGELSRRQLAAFRQLTDTATAARAEMVGSGKQFVEQVEEYLKQRR